MICVAEEISLLTRQEQQLHQSLDNLRGQPNLAKDRQQIEKELRAVLRKRHSLQAWKVFELGMPVHRLNSSQLGIVKELKITPGGMGEVWVSWDGLLQIPEQPNLLLIDGFALAKIIAKGDRIKIVDGHKSGGKTFTVERPLARGAVETTNEQIFERSDWLLIEGSKPDAVNQCIEPVDINGSIPEITSKIQMVNPESMKELAAHSESGVVTVEAVVTTVQEIGELSQDEEKERHRLELKVERAYYEAGSALRELKDKRLYRSTHRTFDAYCQQRFGLSSRHSYRLIEAANVVNNLKEFCDQFGHILPAKESVCRSLTIFQPNQQIFAWQQILQETGGKHPTGLQVKGIVERLKEKPLIKASDFCTVGDPFILTRLEGAERKYNGCWAIASQLRDFTIAVDVHDNTLTVKPDNLDPIDLPDVRRQLPETLKRIKHLRNCGLLDRCAYTVLESLGRQIYLTDFEEKLLVFMETEYKV